MSLRKLSLQRKPEFHSNHDVNHRAKLFYEQGRKAIDSENDMARE